MEKKTAFLSSDSPSLSLSFFLSSHRLPASSLFKPPSGRSRRRLPFVPASRARPTSRPPSSRKKSAFLRRTTSTARIWRRRRARSLGRLWEFVSHRSCHAIFPRHSLIVSHPPSLTPQCNNLFFLGYPFLTKKERKPKTQGDKKNGDVGRDFWQKQERKKERGKEGKGKVKKRDALIHPLEMGLLKSCLVVRLTRSSRGLPILDSSRRA